MVDDLEVRSTLLLADRWARFQLQYEAVFVADDLFSNACCIGK